MIPSLGRMNAKTPDGSGSAGGSFEHFASCIAVGWPAVEGSTTHKMGMT